MRQIKFRVWDGKEMYYAPLLHMITSNDFEGTCGLGVSFNAVEGAILLQFTGLLDKNGKEIYVGDVVIINEDDDAWTDVIVKDKNWLELSKYKNHCVTNISLYEHHKEVRVIGNIYENPELIKEAGL